MLHSPKRIIVCEKDASRLQFIRRHYPQVLTVQPEDCTAFVRAHSDHGGADVVLEVAGADTTFRLAWECARPNAIVTVVALYDKAQPLPLPEMYGKTLTFKTGGVDGCACEETLRLIAEGKSDTEPLITHTYQRCIRDRHRAEYFVQPQCILRRAGYRGKDHEQVPAQGIGKSHVSVGNVCGAFRGPGLR